jgi:D-tyrosyl-tRNA(Tyr) deacylase
MIAVVQRVSRASVRVAGETVGAIEAGLLVLLGIAQGDTGADAEWLADKCAELRIFPDDEGKMNRSVEDRSGAVLVVSQFTLLGDCVKGRRPSFTKAAPPAEADRLYRSFARRLRGRGLKVATGVFQARMEVELVNDGPVTLLLDSARRTRRQSASGQAEPRDRPGSEA